MKTSKINPKVSSCAVRSIIKQWVRSNKLEKMLLRNSESVENTGFYKNDSVHPLHVKTPLNGAFYMEQIKNRARDVSLSNMRRYEFDLIE